MSVLELIWFSSSQSSDAITPSISGDATSQSNSLIFSLTVASSKIFLTSLILPISMAINGCPSLGMNPSSISYYPIFRLYFIIKADSGTLIIFPLSENFIPGISILTTVG